MIENTVVWQSVGSLVYKLKEGRGFTEGKRNLENEVWFNIYTHDRNPEKSEALAKKIVELLNKDDPAIQAWAKATAEELNNLPIIDFP